MVIAPFDELSERESTLMLAELVEAGFSPTTPSPPNTH